MAFDGLFLHAVVNEIENKALNAKVDKIFQPEKDEIIIAFRCFGENIKLLLSANSTAPRLQFTGLAKENPKTAPLFCMILRKHLMGAKLKSISQFSLERIVRLSFSCYDEFSEPCEKHIIIEIMGRHSNIILVSDEEKIIDSIKHIDLTVSTQRLVLPSLPYHYPPTQNKMSFLELDEKTFSSFLAQNEAQKLDKALLGAFLGFSPLIARELSYLCAKQTDIEMKELSPSQKEKLFFFINTLKFTVKDKSFTPIMLLEAALNKPFEFYFMNILQYGTKALSTKYESFSLLLDSFYEKRDKADRIKQRSGDILKVLTTASERISRKMNAQKKDLEDCDKKDSYLLYGDLINANIYRIRSGDKKTSLENYYDENKLIEIILEETLSPAQNAQKYYREYKKAKSAKQYINEQLSQGLNELHYLDTVFDGLAKAETELELNELREELFQNGYIKKRKQQNSKKMPPLSKPMEFISSDGFTILCGKNNLQNDRLTLKTTSKRDLWFHIKTYAGSHTVILKGEAETIPNTTLEEAAKIAALYSRAGASQNIAVDYTEIKNVKKPSGAKAGMVIYENFKTVFVTPHKEEIETLRKV